MPDGHAFLLRMVAALEASVATENDFQSCLSLTHFTKTLSVTPIFFMCFLMSLIDVEALTLPIYMILSATVVFLLKFLLRVCSVGAAAT